MNAVLSFMTLETTSFRLSSGRLSIEILITLLIVSSFLVTIITKNSDNGLYLDFQKQFFEKT